MSTHSWFSDVIPFCGLKQCIHEGIDASDLAHETLVDLVVARQVRQDSSHTCDDIDV